jgi:hypothetical protein
MDINVTSVQREMAAEKRKKDRKDRERETGSGDSPMTPAHEVAEAEMVEMGRDKGPDAEAARKAISDIGCTDGPGMFGEPHDMPPAGSYDRPFLDAGHSAPSPQHGPPNTSPMPPQGRGILTPLEQSPVPVVAGPGLNGPIAATMAAHQARASATMPRMPIPGGAA